MRRFTRKWKYLLAQLSSKPANRRIHSARRPSHALGFESLEDRRVLAAITVSTLNDMVNGNVTSISALIASPGVDGISLREAVEAANSDAAGDTISFSVTGTITLSSLGPLAIDEVLTIDGPGAGSLTIRAYDPTPDVKNGDGDRVFLIDDPSGGATPPLVDIEGLTLLGGDVDVTNPTQEGGAIRSEGRLVLRNSVLKANHAFRGGAVFVEVAGGGTTAREVLRIEGSVIEHNDAVDGGGVAIVSGDAVAASSDTITITGTTIRFNDATGTLSNGGGGIFADLYGAALTLVDSTISGNTTAAASSTSGYYGGGGGGGGVYARLGRAASLTVSHVEVFGNVATYGNGGGILAKAFYDSSNPFPTPRSITISRSTIAENTADDRGGGLFTYNRAGTEALVEETRITGNAVPSTSSGSFRNGGGVYAYVWDDTNGANEGVLTPRFTITRSTVDDNETPSMGGGIFVCSKFFGNFIATNTTISGNRSTDETNGAGGGMFIAHYQGAGESVDAYLRNLTVTQNISALGGGIATFEDADTRVRVANSIISENFAPQPDPSSQPTPNNFIGRIEVGDFKNNLVGSTVRLVDVNNTIVLQDLPSVNTIPSSNHNLLFNNAPHLRPLADNGGWTPTHAPRYEPSNLIASPAIDAGADSLASIPLTSNPAVPLGKDQRGEGFSRVFDFPNRSGPDGTVDIGAYELQAPKVTDVIIKASTANQTYHPPYRFSTATVIVDGEVQPVAGSGNQLRTVPVGGADTVEIEFSEELANLSSTSLTLLSLRGAGLQAMANNGYSYNSTTRTGSWRFAAPLAPDQYLIQLTGSVADAASNQLDGEWTNPFSVTTTNELVSEFPSGDGTAGGTFRFVFTVLPGDADQSNLVDGADFLIWMMNFGGTTQGFTEADFNGDGLTNNTDYAIYLNNSGIYVLHSLLYADFDGNGIVNGSDYYIWSQHWGQAGDHEDGDADHDGLVENDDFFFWQRQQGLQIVWVA